MPLDGSDRFIDSIGWLTDGGDFALSNDGAYTDPVAEGIAVLPPGWRDRLILVETENMKTPRGVQARAWVLEPHDLAASKYVAGREKDFAFCSALLRRGVLDRVIIEKRLDAIREARPDKSKFIENAFAALAS